MPGTRRKKPSKPPDEPKEWIWLNDKEDVGVGDCGCTLYRNHESSGDPAVILCPLHAGADELLAMLEEVQKSADLTFKQIARLDDLLKRVKTKPEKPDEEEEGDDPEE